MECLGRQLKQLVGDANLRVAPSTSSLLKFPPQQVREPRLPGARSAIVQSTSLISRRYDKQEQPRDPEASGVRGLFAMKLSHLTAQLRIQGSAGVSDDLQMRAAGFAEGYLSAGDIVMDSWVPAYA